MKKKFTNLLKITLIFALCLVFAVPAYAEDTENTEENTEVYVDSDIDLLSDGELVDIFDPVFEDFTLEEKLELLREIFPQGMYWNRYGYDGEGPNYLNISYSSCWHDGGYSACNQYWGNTAYYFPYANNIQCLGFASMISDFLFGQDSGFEVFYDWESLDVGDHIRLVSNTHSMIVIEKTDSYIKVVECNSDYNTCFINWDRQISRDKLMYSSGSFKFFKRTN